jgi:hypothetical protein
MKEHGTLFKADMVRALRREHGPKTQTRRLFTRHNSLVDGARATPALWADLDFGAAWVDAGPSPAGNAGPYLKVPRRSEDSVHRVYATIAVGDLLWVRESCMTFESTDGRNAHQVRYRADADFGQLPKETGSWACRVRNSIHMPRWACRVELEIVAVRVERLQQIGEADAEAEGVLRLKPDLPYFKDYLTSNDDEANYTCLSAVASYRTLWAQIHGDGSWAANPWARVFEFRRIAS